MMIKNNKAQHTSLVFLVLFIAIVSVFTTISVVQNNDGVPTGLVVDEQMQNNLALQQETLNNQVNEEKTCNYDSWFRNLACNLGIESWFYKTQTTTTVYTLDEEGNVVDATVLGDETVVKSDLNSN